MFLEKVMQRNPDLIDYAVSLHQSGAILPDTYVIDLDALKSNASLMNDKAKSLDIELYFMLKQIGRNPVIAKELIDSGIKKAVVVDFKEALIMMENNIPIGNIGHLVQVPDKLLKKVMTYGVDYITVYSLDKLKKINEMAKTLGITQKIMLRVIDEEDELYPGQYGGFTLSELDKLIPAFTTLSNCHINGITSFPCFLYNKELNSFSPTHNIKTLHQAKSILEENGLEITEINIPSATSIETLPLIKEAGGTQGEPGHALTGTSPMHAVEDLKETPAYVYVSEVSHTASDRTFIYGGGYYARGKLENALIDNKGNRDQVKVKQFPSENIDYYLEIDKVHDIGSTAVMAFRTQVFVTRSHVALVKGLSSKKPELIGLFDSQGRALEGGVYG